MPMSAYPAEDLDWRAKATENGAVAVRGRVVGPARGDQTGAVVGLAPGCSGSRTLNGHRRSMQQTTCVRGDPMSDRDEVRRILAGPTGAMSEQLASKTPTTERSRWPKALPDASGHIMLFDVAEGQPALILSAVSLMEQSGGRRCRPTGSATAGPRSRFRVTPWSAPLGLAGGWPSTRPAGARSRRDPAAGEQSRAIADALVPRLLYEGVAVPRAYRPVWKLSSAHPW